MERPETGKMKTAVFLDRDGTLIHDKGFITDPDDVVFYKRTFEALKMLQRRFELFVISNQSGIAKGMQTVKETERINRHVVRRLRAEGIWIRDFYYCPHRREDGCRCIKPKPFFAQKAAADHGICLTGSFSVGDHPHDVELARNFGGTGVYVLTGHGRNHTRELPRNVFAAKNILAAARYILEQPLSEDNSGSSRP